MKHVEPQSIANVNKKISYLKSCFTKFAQRYDECPANPFEGMALSNRVTPKEREHFTDNDLQKILSKEYLPSTVQSSGSCSTRSAPPALATATTSRSPTR